MNTVYRTSKTYVFVALILFALFGFALSKNVAALSPGDSAPAFQLDGDSGKIKLDDYKGKVVYVDFWASWCGPCAQSFPWMNSMQSKYGSKGFQIIGINVDAKNEDAKKFLVSTPASFVVAYDPKGVTPKQYGLLGMPSSYLIDKTGKVVFVHSGFNKSDAGVLEAKIKALVEK